MKYKILYHMLKKVKASLSGGDLQLIDKELMKECKKETPSFERVKLLLEIAPKANPNIVDDDGNTPALLAAKQGNSKILKILIAHGANIEEKDRDGNTCIMLAATKRGNSKILQILIDNKANINQENRDGNTPALLAAKHGNVENLKILIDHGANINEKDGEGNTCIMLAASRMDSVMFFLLLEKGGMCDDTIKNSANQTTLDLVEKNIANGNEYHKALILSHLKTLSLTNQLEKSPLEIDLEQIRKLFSSKPFPRQIVINGDPNDMTATMLASINGHLEALKYLVEQEFDYNGQNMDGMTCTLYAAMHGHLNILEYLVEKGAKWDESIKNNDGRTCMTLAVEFGNVEIVEYLVSKGGVCEAGFIQLTQDDKMIQYLKTILGEA